MLFFKIIFGINKKCHSVSVRGCYIHYTYYFRYIEITIDSKNIIFDFLISENKGIWFFLWNRRECLKFFSEIYKFQIIPTRDGQNNANTNAKYYTLQVFTLFCPPRVYRNMCTYVFSKTWVSAIQYLVIIVIT